MKDFNTYENEVFDILPEKIEGCNFINCTFNASSFIETSNLRDCIINAAIHFNKSNIINCDIFVESCIFERSNNVHLDENGMPIIDEINEPEIVEEA